MGHGLAILVKGVGIIEWHGRQQQDLVVVCLPVPHRLIFSLFWLQHEFYVLFAKTSLFELAFQLTLTAAEVNMFIRKNYSDEHCATKINQLIFLHFKTYLRKRENLGNIGMFET